MGLFDTKTAAEKAEAKAAKEAQDILAALEKYGMNLEAYDAKTIQQKNVDNIKIIASRLFGTGFYSATTFGSNGEKATVGFLGAIVQQNWILIRQQEQIIRLLDKIVTNVDL